MAARAASPPNANLACLTRVVDLVFYLDQCCCITLIDIFRAFEYFILVTIFANCVALAINTPYPMNDSDSVNAFLVC